MLFSFNATAQFTTGDGSEADPYIITTASELAQLAAFVNDGDEDYNDKFYKLGNDLNLSDYQTGEGWTPIGLTQATPFKGVFDGYNNVVTGFFLNCENYANAGLFGCLVDGTVKNLGMVDVNITYTNDYEINRLGAIAGWSDATSVIDNCYVTGSITALVYLRNVFMGSIVGTNSGIIMNCWSTASVYAFSDVEKNQDIQVTITLGGIAGQTTTNTSLITKCYYNGSVKNIGNCLVKNTGGITGTNGRDITNCWTAGTVISYTPPEPGDPPSGGFVYATRAGGIAGNGSNSTLIQNCYTLASARSELAFYPGTVDAGGIIGSGPAVGSVALNPIIKSIGGYSTRIGRVTGNGNPTNNYAFNGMFNTNGTTEWENIGANLRDGADITLEEILADGTFGGFFTSENGWVTENGKLPGFGAAEDIYLLNPFVATIIVDDGGAEIGATQNIDANVLGFNINGTVTWEVEGGSSGTSITNAGALTIAPNETARKLILTATSTEDNTISGSGTYILTGGGNGTEDNPFIITTAGAMVTISELVNNNSPFRQKHFKLGNNIDLSEYGENYDNGEGWNPIGKFSGNSFTGTFDGDGYEISGLYSNKNYYLLGSQYAGLFGFVTQSVIKNLGLVDAVFIANSTSSPLYFGGIVGWNESVLIENCYVTGTMSSTTVPQVYIGGIAGISQGAYSPLQIIGCWSDVTINVNTRGTQYSAGGGIAGVNYLSQIINCYSKGSITISSASTSSTFDVIVGGITGNNRSRGEISNCWSTVMINSLSSASAYAGGITGDNSNALSSIVNSAALNPNIVCEGITKYFGRVTGRNLGTLTNNFAYDNMFNPDGDTIWENIGEDAKDGENINRLVINTDGKLGGLFTEENGWAVEDGKLPGIGEPVDMPLHLLIPDGTFTVSGKITGVDIEDELEGVVVTLSGFTNYSATTDESGNYVIENVDGGMTFNYTIRATLYGYYTYETTILVASDLEHDITLNVIPKFTISGIVTGTIIPEPVEDVEITLTGYGELSTTTNVSGYYSIEVYDGYTYTLCAIKSDCAVYTAEITIDGEDVDHSFSMVEILYPPGAVTASEVGNNVVITWDEPNTPVTFRYDSGIVTNRIGFDNGNFPNSVFGSCHRVGASLTSISWNTNVTPVNVQILALNADGKPSTTVLYSALNVPGTSQEWSTHQFPEPVEALNGFFISVGQASLTNIGIGFSAGTTDYPFIPQTNFYASNYQSGSFTALDGTQFEGNFMVRAEGISMGKSVIFGYQDNLRECSGYNAYRLKLGQENNETSWMQIATNISETTFTDTDWSSITWGQYRYAVRAVYSIGLSTPVLSNIVNNKMLVDYGINISTNSGLPATGATVTLTNQNDPSRVYTSISGADGVLVTDVWRGMYSLKVALAGYVIYTAEDLDITNVNLSWDVELIDEIYPVGSVTAKIEGGNAVIEWNTGIPPVNDWINWCVNDEIEGRIGYGETTGNDMTMAIRFTPADLAANRVVSGHTINKVAIGIGQNMAQVTSMEIRIWQGGTGINSPGQLLYTQPITNYATFTEMEMNEITLTTPFVIDASRELRIGWRLVNTAGYPFGRDVGPCVAPGKSDLFICPAQNNGAWVSYSAVYGWNNNISIKAFVSNGELRMENGELFAETVGAYPMWSPEKQTVGAYHLWSSESLSGIAEWIIENEWLFAESGMRNIELRVENGELFAESGMQNFDYAQLLIAEGGRQKAESSLLVASSDLRLTSELENDFSYSVTPVILNSIQNSYSINRSPKGFTIYRLIEGQTTGWTKLAENVTAMVYTDTEWAELADGVYQYAIVSIFGSGESEAVLSNPIVKEQTIFYTVTVSAGEGGSVEIVGYDTLTEQIEEGTTVTVKATANDPTYDFIEWTDTLTGETISSLPVYSFTVSEDVTLTANFELVGINGMGISGYTIYPNPAENELRIKNYELRDGLLSRTLSAVKVEVFDIFGRNIVGAYRIRPITDRQNEIVIDVSKLPSGVYMIKLFDGQNYVTQRFVKK